MKCPNCQNKLTLMGVIELKPKKVNDIVEDRVELQYNCEKCTYDWKIELTLSPNLDINPIFWG